MYYLLFQRVVELYGINVAHTLAFLIDAITRRLTMNKKRHADA